MRPGIVPSLCRLWLAWLALASFTFAHAADAPPQEQLFDAGLKAYRQGAFEEAITQWSNAARAAEAGGKRSEHIAALEHLAQAQIALGHYVQAIRTLETAANIAEAAPDPARLAALWAALGNAHLAIGSPQSAEQYLRRSLELARPRDAARTAAVLNDLGNLYAVQEKYAQAIAAYQE